MQKEIWEIPTIKPITLAEYKSMNDVLKAFSGLTLQQIINELWHISRTALAIIAPVSNYQRMQYIKDHIVNYYPHLIPERFGKPSHKELWFTIENQLR